MLDLLVIAILAGSFAFCLYLFHSMNKELRQENQQLIDRLMARNLTEFKYAKTFGSNGHQTEADYAGQLEVFLQGGEDLSGI